MQKFNKKTNIIFMFLFLIFFNIKVTGENNSIDEKKDLNNLNNEKLPIYFEEIDIGKNNKVFRASGLNYNIMLRRNEALLLFLNNIGESKENTFKKDHVSNVGDFTPVYLRFINANNASIIIGKDKLVKEIKYYTSNDREVIKNINLYKEIEFKDIYPGVDVVFSGNKKEFSYIFYISSKSDVNNILLELDGIKDLYLDANNNIVFDIYGQKIIQTPPKIIIIENNKKIESKCNFYIKDKNLISLILNK